MIESIFLSTAAWFVGSGYSGASLSFISLFIKLVQVSAAVIRKRWSCLLDMSLMTFSIAIGHDRK